MNMQLLYWTRHPPPPFRVSCGIFPSLLITKHIRKNNTNVLICVTRYSTFEHKQIRNQSVRVIYISFNKLVWGAVLLFIPYFFISMFLKIMFISKISVRFFLYFLISNNRVLDIKEMEWLGLVFLNIYKKLHRFLYIEKYGINSNINSWNKKKINQIFWSW